MSLFRLSAMPVLLAAAGLLPAAGAGQVADSAEVHGAARDAQAAFERARLRNAPDAVGSWGGDCDEIVGRMCLRLRETGDWWPGPPDPDDVAARDELLRALSRAGDALPGDLWILAQRTYYLWEAGRPEAALPLLTPCRVTPAWWCDALAGYALHRSHRFPEAAEAFDRALAGMPPGDDGLWRDPRLVVDREGRETLDRAGQDWGRLVRRLWALSDPLFLVPGNDRWTEHMARRVQEFMHEDARNGYGLRWGGDLAETLVRYGPEIGWEERRPRPGEVAAASDGIGHQHPELRSLVAPGRAMVAPSATEPQDWNPGDRHLPRSGYAPAYAPVILPAPGAFRLVPRGRTLAVVSDIALPEDTSYHAAHGHPPLPRPQGLGDGAPRFGLFAVDPDGRVVARAEGPDGRLAVTVPPGRYILSAEVWAPDSLRAGRVRQGVEWTGVPEDVPMISDLLLADPAAGDPASMDAALPWLRTGVDAERVAPGETILVAWELSGLGWRPAEPLRYELGFQEAGDGFFRRAGRFLGLVGDPWSQDLRWSEEGPPAPGPFFRATRLTFPPDMAEGAYLIRLEVGMEGRQSLVAERVVRVSRDAGSR
ncbi:MAG TPA: hypothetical protein VK858_05930 [Longimicrobiales bacterium]|nr:hypothetical protein [Longimicrobiales bacterium]